MKLRSFILIAGLSLLITACNFTLAEDVTPPPGYVAPTPLPTLVLSPAQAPSVENGRLIYAEKCAACHGETGLGDGEQGIQLGVTVPAFGLPEIARPATPANWFTTVTRGRMDRLMPPFASLNDEERWDVVAYALSLHIPEEQAEQGRKIFEANCADCATDLFQDQSRMSALSEVDLARIVRQGNETIPAFGKDLSDEEMWAAAAYLRTLSFDYSIEQAAAPASTSTPEAAPATQTLASAEAGTPAGEGTPVAESTSNTAEGTGQGTAEAATVEPAAAREGFGTVSGTIDNQTGEDLPSGLKVTLRGYDHQTDPSAGPQEVFSQEGTVDGDGNYTFENIELPANRIFVSEVKLDDITMKSDFGIVEEGTSLLGLPPIVLYGMTNDTSLLAMDEVRMFLEYGDSDIQVFGVYSFRNPSDKTVIVELKDGSEVPFIKVPEGTTVQGYEALQDSEPFVNTDKGMAIPPSEGSYGLIAFTTVPKQDEFEIVQPFVLPASNLAVFLPEGVTAESTALNDEGLQNLQNFNFQVYTAQNVEAGETIRLTVSGNPETTPDTDTAAVEPPANTRQNILIGAGMLGVTLIAAGAWLYLRDRNRGEGEEEEADAEPQEFDSSEDVLDAIVALDDLHRAKKISDEAYLKRREQLKDILKGMM